MKKYFLYPLLLIFALFSCCQDKSTVEGLWVVKHVKVGNQEMTPNARWMRFNADSTQESGNGWFQHSFGTWSMNNKTNELAVKNTNGLNDPFPPFKVSVDDNTMTWNRIEEGENVTVTLEKTNRLPETYGDQLLGLWQLTEATGEGAFFNSDADSSSAESIFFRWDNIFVIQSANGRISGVYNVNGHKPELELIPYSDNLERNFWHIDFDEDTITLKLLNSDSLITRNFVRIHDFLN